MTQILKILTDRETDLARRRTRYLATGNWVKVIQTEARLEELAEVKKAVVDSQGYPLPGIKDPSKLNQPASSPITASSIREGRESQNLGPMGNTD